MKARSLLRLFILSAILAFQSLSASASLETIKLPMKDGIKLATDVHLPTRNGPFPVIFLRTTYNRTMGSMFAPEALKRGFALVVQDTRGRFASEGENLAFDADAWGEHQDGLDTINWIVEQPWCSGKIGTFGGSALSITTLLLAGTGTPHLTCQHFTVGAPNLYSVVYTGGVFRKALAEDWLKQSKFSEAALELWTRHPLYDDYWKQRDLTRRYAKINAPAVHIGGWYDIFAQGTIDAFMGYQYQGGPGARGKQKLVMGPWTHGVLQEKAGELKFPKGNKPPTKVTDSWAWFEYWLKGTTNGIADAPAVTYYVMGDVSDPQAPGNVWRTAGEWPPPQAKEVPFYLHEGRRLAKTKPKTGPPITYRYDPKTPVPTLGGPQLTLPAGPMDQQSIEARPDLIAFTSETLTEPLEVTGKVRVKLWASSDARDTDFFAKLCDVYPDGRSYNICEGAIRARLRKGLDQEKLLKPGTIYPFEIDLWSTSIIFNKGHKLRLHITSSSDRGYDPNPNTGEPFRASNKAVVAKNTLYLDARHPSHILLPVMPE